MPFTLHVRLDLLASLLPILMLNCLNPPISPMFRDHLQRCEQDPEEPQMANTLFGPHDGIVMALVVIGRGPHKLAENRKVVKK